MSDLVKDSLSKVQQDLEEAAGNGELPLAQKAEDIVPGDGGSKATIMMIGEAPGAEEAKQRKPFVGRSGQFLRKAIAEVELKPEQYYISNIVKVRPPGNRDPKPEEILAYKPFLDREIELLQPKIILTLGRFSMAKFIANAKISAIHGRLHKVAWNDQTLFVLPMFHPAAALYRNQLKETFINDFKKVPQILKWIDQNQEGLEFEDTVKDALF
jgi:uracil-DNA glycosylase family 4